MTPQLIGTAAVIVGLLVAAFVIADPGRTRLPRERRRPDDQPDSGALTSAAEAATSLMGRLIRSREGALSHALDLAGIKLKAQDFAFLVAVAALVLVVVFLLAGAGWLALVGVALAPLGGAILMRLKTSARRKAFAAQLDAMLQLLASNLRAGYSTMQALISVAKDSEEPTASELVRAVNEARVGRPVVEALETVAERMRSEDFKWTAQAIAINREVGGSLAEVLDGVAATIRDRGQIRRHVEALSAEGKMSGVILMVLPFLVAGFLMLINPGYMDVFFTNPIGIVMLVVAIILLVVGGIWLRKAIEVKF